MTHFQPPAPAPISCVGACLSASPRERSEREVVGARHAVPLRDASAFHDSGPVEAELAPPLLAGATRSRFVVAQLAAPVRDAAKSNVILSVAKNLSWFFARRSSSAFLSLTSKLSSRAQRAVCSLLVLAAALAIPAAAQQSARPKITGIGRATIYVRDHEAAVDFYGKQLGYHTGRDVPCEDAPHTCFAVGVEQIVDVVSPSSPAEGHFLGEVDFETRDLVAMHRFLQSQHVQVSEISVIKETAKSYEARYFTLQDPDGHQIGFIQFGGCVACQSHEDHHASSHIIHAGFVVRDRAAEDHFYKDILGFRPYWHGGMKEGQDDWVSMQVPDGTDWLEFMVSVSPNADHHTLGVMNHIALGVSDIHSAQQQLIKNGWKPGEQPKIGRDGKWQLNVYDPDQTRVEFMEFTPVQKPCCSDFTGPHPEP
jgi:catechol 2,3-dioxygenase-like lactoylglutathione lyase family enzyme